MKRFAQWEHTWLARHHGYRGGAGGVASGEARGCERRLGGGSSWSGRCRIEQSNQWYLRRNWRERRRREQTIAMAGLRVNAAGPVALHHKHRRTEVVIC